jgi:hypothetical protein
VSKRVSFAIITFFSSLIIVIVLFIKIMHNFNSYFLFAQRTIILIVFKPLLDAICVKLMSYVTW